MDELIDLVVEKTGISKEEATQAVETVMDYLKEELPKPVADQAEAVLSGDIDPQGLAEGLFGGKE